MYDDYENDDGEFEAMVRFRRQEQAYIDESKVERLSEQLMQLLGTDYVGHPTANQLKMGVSTLELLVETLTKFPNCAVVGIDEYCGDDSVSEQDELEV